MSNDQYIYNVLCFSTNKKTYEPLSVLKNYIISSGYNPKKIIRYNPLDFYYQTKSTQILISFHQIINFNEVNMDICHFAESYIIMIDLESNDTYNNINEIVDYMNNLCDSEKTVFVLGLYSNPNNIKNNLNEANVKEFLDKKNLIYEYVESNIKLTRDFIKTIDYIIEEGIKKVETKIKEGDLNNKIDSDSKSRCVIF